MFDLPSLDVDNVELIADWVELCVLCSEDAILSHNDVGDVFKDASLVATEEGDIPKDDYDYGDDLIFSSDDKLGRLTEEIWTLIRRRQRRGGYPFKVDSNTVARSCEKWQCTPAYTMLLLTDICRRYELSSPVALEADSSSGRLFEKIVEAATLSLFRGSCVRFGWPRDDEWPTGINDRIEYLGSMLDVDVELLEGKTQPADKDRGLDVVARLEFGDRDEGCPYFLIQCAIGNNWKSKRGEPTLESWNDVLQWNGPLIRAVAVPWRLEEPYNYKWTYRHFGATVLDRPRLITGAPDDVLDPSDATSITDWCTHQLQKIPDM